MELSEFQRIFHGLEHGGMRVELDRERSTGGHIAHCNVVDLETGELVGSMLRWTFEREGKTWVWAEYMHLRPEYQRRGLVSAIRDRAYQRYRELGYHAIAMSARDDGALIWHKWGYDFDLHDVPGADDARKRARAVAEIFSPDAPRRRRWHRVPGFRAPNPHVVLRRSERRRGPRGLAAAEMRRRIPTEEQIESGDLVGTFTTPAEIIDFESHGIKLGLKTMRYAKWNGMKLLT